MSDLWNISLDDGETYDKFIDTDSVHWDDAGDYVGKNLLHYDTPTQTINGVTFTVNADKTITVDGTNNSGSTITFNLMPDTLEFNAYKGKSMYISGGTDNASVFMAVRHMDSTPTSMYSNNGPDQLIEIPSNIRNSAVSIQVENGKTCDNIIIKPMIRLASIIDDTYEPYLPSNRELDGSTVHWGDQSKGYVGKNQIKVDAISHTQSGVTFTINADKSITLNGTASSTWGWNICNPSESSNLRSLRGDYVLSYEGTLASGCGVSLQLNTGNYVNIDNTTHTTNTTFTDSIYPTGRLHIYITSGSVWNNVTIKPMLRLASISDNTYEPYAHQNTEIPEKVSYADNGFLGAKNFLPILFNSAANSFSSNGVTFTKNSDDSITINGTATDDISTFITGDFDIEENTYILSAGDLDAISTNEFTLQLYKHTSSSGFADPHMFIYNESKKQLLTTGTYHARIFIKSGKVINNMTIKCMLRLASDPDDTYAPYAMTNRELTESVEFLSTALTSGNTKITIDEAAVYKFGKVVNLRCRFKCTETTLNAEEIVFTLPATYRPNTIRYYRTWDIGASATDENQELIISSNGDVVLKILNTHNTGRWIQADITYITTN